MTNYKKGVKNITRRDLADVVTTELGGGGVAYQFVADFFDTLSEAIVEEEKVLLHNFGCFRLRSKKMRMGRNPRTGAPVQIPAHRAITFIASPNFKAFVNNADETDEG